MLLILDVNTCCTGGTGSGLGSYITEMLADNYPGVSLLNSVVCPYAAGEVCAFAALTYCYKRICCYNSLKHEECTCLTHAPIIRVCR
jgi:Tubulin/FtsZ family, GTPase domain